jgi:hypothetical protein
MMQLERSPHPKKQVNAARGHLNHVNVEEAEESPDIVMGMFLVHSTAARVLFDSRASHSFVTEPFVKKSGMTLTLMD